MSGSTSVAKPLTSFCGKATGVDGRSSDVAQAAASVQVIPCQPGSTGGRHQPDRLTVALLIAESAFVFRIATSEIELTRRLMPVEIFDDLLQHRLTRRKRTELRAVRDFFIPKTAG